MSEINALETLEDRLKKAVQEYPAINFFTEYSDARNQVIVFWRIRGIRALFCFTKRPTRDFTDERYFKGRITTVVSTYTNRMPSLA